MIKAILPLLLAQWHSAANAQSSAQPQLCYYSANNLLESVFLPCGDPQNGFKTCCEAGDNCLANNACYSPGFGTTYLAGCTDPDYKDGSCPEKPNLEDHPWTGLVVCNGTTTDWFACGDGGPTITHGMGCLCPDTSRTLAFTAANSPIQSIMNVGLALGDSSCFPSFTVYCSGASPTPSPSSTTLAVAPSSTATSTSIAPQTSSPSLTTNRGGVVSTVFVTWTPDAPTSTSLTMPSNSSNTTDAGGFSPMEHSAVPNAGLQKEAKIGIGVGSAIGAVLVGAVLWYYTSYMRKRHNKSASTAGDHSGPDSAADADGFAEKDNSGDDDPRSPAWSGHKSELPADKDPRNPALSGHKSELPADEHEARSPVPVYESYSGSYRNSLTAEAEGSQRYDGQSREVREGVYEMP